MSYDNERSVALKAEFAYDAGLAGVTIIILSYSPLIILSYLSNLSYSSYFFSLISKLQVMTWSIDTDDFEGICNGPKFPLLRTLNHALHNRWSKAIWNHHHSKAWHMLCVIKPLIWNLARGAILTCHGMGRAENMRWLRSRSKKWLQRQKGGAHMRSFAVSHLSKAATQHKQACHNNTLRFKIFQELEFKLFSFSGSRESTPAPHQPSPDCQLLSSFSPFSPSPAICPGCRNPTMSHSC